MISQFLTQQPLSNDGLIQKQNNNEYDSTFEVDRYFSSPEQQQAVSPALTSHSRITCSEQSNQEFSHLAPTSKKISKDFNKIGKGTLAKAKKRLRRDLWKPKEDKMLLELIDIYGLKWTVIGKQIGGRTGKQVRDRYTNYLRPGINSNSWNTEEDEKFISLYFQFGNKWSQIAKFLPGRSECQVKNRFHSYIKEMLSMSKQKENTISIKKSDSFSEKTDDKKDEMVKIPVDCQEYANEVSNNPHKESNGSYNKGKQDQGFEISLDKRFEKEKNEQEIISQSEGRFNFPNTLNDCSFLDQGYPSFLLNFKEENNNFLGL